MTNEDGGFGDHIPRTRLSDDLCLILGANTLLWVVTLFPILKATPLRIMVAVPFTLFIPGYALIAALFPEGEGMNTEGHPSVEGGSGPSFSADLGLLERAVLSFGSSIALVPLIGMALNFMPWGIRLWTILASLTLLTGLLTLIAVKRRAQLPANERFDPSLGYTLQTGLSRFRSAANRGELLLTVVLLLSVCITAGGIGYAISAQPETGSFTEFYLLTENETGDPVAGNYPANMTVGEKQQIIVGIGNHEGEPANYTVVIELQEVQMDGNQTIVTDSEELDRFTPRLQSNETVHSQQQLIPTELTGQRLRLQFQLYRGNAPRGDAGADPYRETHLWMNVSAVGQSDF